MPTPISKTLDTDEQFSKLVCNAVKDGWTVRLLENGKLVMTKPKSQLKQEVSFNGNKYVSKLMKQ